MTIDIKTPQQLAEDYLANLKALRPEVNTDQEDSDWWIRSRVVGGVAGGISSDLNKVSNDCFPQSARREALEQHLITYFGSGFLQATYSEGSVTLTGASGTTVPQGQRMKHLATLNEYITQVDAIIGAGGTATVDVKSSVTGQAQNLLTGTTLQLQSPPSNIGVNATVLAPGISDGRDVESTPAASARVLQRIRNPVRGGTEEDYKFWASASNPSVVSSKILRHRYGLGTVSVVISAGTSDIDQAIDNDQAVVVIPTEEVLTAAQNYIDGYNPLTDAVYCDAPIAVPIDVTASVTFASGDGSTIPGGSTVSQLDLVKREIKRAIYKTPIGGRIKGDYGYVFASELEAMIDLNLAAGQVGTGIKYQIVKDRQVADLSATGANRRIASNEVAIPGTITVTVV
jgi:uncharacterized phage protein gp47/JayE